MGVIKHYFGMVLFLFLKWPFEKYLITIEKIRQAGFFQSFDNSKRSRNPFIEIKPLERICLMN
jgi:hypothetical protein